RSRSRVKASATRCGCPTRSSTRSRSRSATTAPRSRSRSSGEPPARAPVVSVPRVGLVGLGIPGATEAVELARAAGVRDGLVAEVTRATGALSTQSDVFLEISERRRRDPGPPHEQDAFRTYSALLEKDLRAAVEL